MHSQGRVDLGREHLASFFTGYRQTDFRLGEIITAIDI